jgi:F420-dependent oxidoreductase-like protein
VKIGVVLPQGWAREYAGWEPARAWARTVALARQAEDLGFESIWLYDHFQTRGVPADELTFEAFTALSALAALTSRVRLGHVVLCAGYRNPALVAKMAGTLDVISGGRFELGLGAGWKEDEYVAYGYGFPSLHDRMGILADSLEVARRMLGPGRATFEGEHAGVRDAINLPKGVQQPRIPIIVGGNGPDVTWRLAARYADELNLDELPPAETKAAMRVIRSRCEEIGRDPGTLRVSCHISARQPVNVDVGRSGAPRRAVLAAYRETGIDRVMAMIALVDDDEALVALAADGIAAGAEIGA